MNVVLHYIQLEIKIVSLPLKPSFKSEPAPVQIVEDRESQVLQYIELPEIENASDLDTISVLPNFTCSEVFPVIDMTTLQLKLTVWSLPKQPKLCTFPLILIGTNRETTSY